MQFSMSTSMMQMFAYTPDLIVVHLERGAQRIIFGQDIHVPFYVDFDWTSCSSVNQWRSFWI
jgi:hypothetical protein